MAFESYSKTSTAMVDLNPQSLQKHARLFIQLEKLLKQLDVSEEFRVKTMESVIKKTLLGN